MEQGVFAHSTIVPKGQDVEHGLHRAIKNSGGATKLARALGISHQAVIKWRRLPAERVLDVERISKISRHDLRPDIYGATPPVYTTGNAALDAAATRLLTGSEAVGASDLVKACDALLARLDWLDQRENTVGMTEEDWSSELQAWGAVFRRAIDEPSLSRTDLAAKARLMLSDMDRFNPVGEDDKDNERLMRVILREVIATDIINPPLVDKLLDAWGEWTKTCGTEDTEDNNIAWARNADIRDSLIDEAAALPATRDNAPAKAIAQSWLEYVAVWERNRPRDAYGIDGRLCLDIHDAVGTSATPAIPVSVRQEAVHHHIDVRAQSLDSLRSIFDVASTVGGICQALSHQPRCHVNGGAGALVEWISEETLRLMDACQQEAMRRKPTCDLDRETRLSLLARAVIDNGDNDQTLAFAREVTAMVEARS